LTLPHRREYVRCGSARKEVVVVPLNIEDPHPTVAALLDRSEIKSRLALTDMEGPAPPYGTTPSDPPLTCFTGYLGEPLVRGDKTWRLLFVDVHLSEWLLFDEADAVMNYRAKDPKAIGGALDYVWVKSEAAVGAGNASNPPETIFLTGAFTRAGDFASSLRGDTYSSPSGLICDAVTPGGCGGRTLTSKP
jgi:hypothetical protein